MRRTISLFVLLTLVGFTGLTPFTHAQTGSQNIQVQLELIANLKKQIAALEEQMRALTTQIVQKQKEQDQTLIQLITTLGEGSRGDQVAILQALLAVDAEIYPEGLITGFYGRLTGNAVKRLQKRHALEQVGIVGPKTRKILNELLKEHPLAFQGSDDDDDKNDDKKKQPSFLSGITSSTPIVLVNGKKPCAIVPPGHLIAPGWLKKHDGVRPLIPVCQVLPPGILKKLDFVTSTPTSTPDIAPPIISGIAIGVSTSSATVSWMTNEPADSQIAYGTSTAYGATTALNSALVTNHTQLISGLSPNTMYHFQVKSRDGSGNLATSTDQTFVTGGIADTIPPIISGIGVTGITHNSATIHWSTNEVSDSQIAYGTSTSYGQMTVLNATLVTSHSENVSGLNASTTYHFLVKSKDASGNLATSSDQMFTTAAPPDTVAPLISGISVSSVSSTSATINWLTDESSTSKVYYSLVSPVNLGSASTTSNGAFVTSHSLNVSGLNASSTYYFVVESQDAALNTATSTQQSLNTNP